MKQPHTDLDQLDLTRKQDRTVLLRAFGKKASHPLKELDDRGVSQILRAMEEHAKEGRNQQSCDVVQKLVQSTERRTLLKEDVCRQVVILNVCQARKRSMHQDVENLRQVRRGLEKTCRLLDAANIVLRLAAAADEQNGPRQSLAWPAIRSRLSVMHKIDPAKLEDSDFHKLLHDLSPAYPPSEGAWTKFSGARQAIDVFVNGLQDLEAGTLRQQQQTMLQYGSRRKDTYRMVLAIRLAQVFERHFGSPPKVSRNHIWYAFLAATLNCCEHRKKPLASAGAYKLWLDARRQCEAEQEEGLNVDLVPICCRKNF